MEFQFQDIKLDHISGEELDKLFKSTQSYELLFNKRAMKYRSMNLKALITTDIDYRKWILSEYTFLKRPVIIIDDEPFIGNSKKNLEALFERLSHI